MTRLLLALLLLPAAARAQTPFASSLGASASLRRLEALPRAWEPLGPTIAPNAPLTVSRVRTWPVASERERDRAWPWIIGGSVAVVMGAIAEGTTGTVLVLGGLGLGGYGVYLLTE
jgi:hypothetical protein